MTRFSSRRGVILPIVLVIIGLLSLTMAGFVFFVRAETAGTFAFREAQQARLAAESGFEEFVTVARLEKHNAAAWYDNPARFRHALVWSAAFNRENDPVRKGTPRRELSADGKTPAEAWRYAIVAANLEDNAKSIRYGVTPESSKLNLNTATDAQLQQLLLPLLTGLEIENGQELINALLDWRDEDDDAREGGAESEYYNTLKPPYRAKNGPFDTIDELLLIKGFNAIVLYGEDVNGNGLLDANEDDGDATEPTYDNADGLLNFGIAPFLTVSGREPDTALDNKQRINLNLQPSVIQQFITDNIEEGTINEETINFILQVKQRNIPLRSPADLLAGVVIVEETPGEPGGEAGAGGEKNPQGEAGGEGDAQGGEGEKADQEGDKKDGRSRVLGEKVERRMQSRGGDTGKKGGGGQSGGQGGGASEDEIRRQIEEAVARQGGDGNPPAGGAQGGDEKSPAGGGGGTEGAVRDAIQRSQQALRGGGRGGPTSQPAGGDITPDMVALLAGSPIKLEEMAIIMDRFSTRQQVGPEGIAGLININTAPTRVLSLLPGITPEAVVAMTDARKTLSPAQLATTAWPLTSGAVDPVTFGRIAPYITTKAYQFRVEVVGYADHIKIARRYEWIVEMLGPLPQVRYQRELTARGFSWPVDDESVVVTQGR
ncbi:MAG: general secretion pathway protein GspK [Phycisphaerales bacterium]|nr:general secretion pathway protein GspK [Phycisphaerales bacterium]